MNQIKIEVAETTRLGAYQPKKYTIELETEWVGKPEDTEEIGQEMLKVIRKLIGEQKELDVKEHTIVKLPSGSRFADTNKPHPDPKVVPEGNIGGVQK